MRNGFIIKFFVINGNRCTIIWIVGLHSNIDSGSIQSDISPNS